MFPKGIEIAFEKGEEGILLDREGDAGGVIGIKSIKEGVVVALKITEKK